MVKIFFQLFLILCVCESGWGNPVTYFVLKSQNTADCAMVETQVWGIQYEATQDVLDKPLTAAAPLLHVQPLILQKNRSLGKKNTFYYSCDSVSVLVTISARLLNFLITPCWKGSCLMLFVPHSHKADLAGANWSVRSTIEYNLLVSALLWPLCLFSFF